jgi:hypothetical protein
MTKIIENVPASDVSGLLAKQGIDPAKPVTVIVDESLEEIARRSREYARKQGMTADSFDRLLKS